MRIGTCHFVSLQDAVRYYARQGIDAGGVKAKLAAGEIHIGPPPLKDGQRHQILLSEMRYHIVDGAD